MIKYSNEQSINGTNKQPEWTFYQSTDRSSEYTSKWINKHRHRGHMILKLKVSWNLFSTYGSDMRKKKLAEDFKTNFLSWRSLHFCCYSPDTNWRSIMFIFVALRQQQWRWISVWKESIRASKCDFLWWAAKVSALHNDERTNQMEMMSDCRSHEWVVTFSAPRQEVLLMEAQHEENEACSRTNGKYEQKKRQKRDEEETSVWKTEKWEEEGTQTKDGNHINHCCQMKMLHLWEDCFPSVFWKVHKELFNRFHWSFSCCQWIFQEETAKLPQLSLQVGNTTFFSNSRKTQHGKHEWHEKQNNNEAKTWMSTRK